MFVKYVLSYYILMV